MAAWKKWFVTIGMLLQGLIGGAIIMLWAFRSETWAQQIDNWLYSEYGQYTILALSGYLIFTALLTLGIAIFRPTTSRQLTIAKDGASHLQIDRAAVENSVRHSIAHHEIYNPQTKVKLLKNRQMADVQVEGMMSSRTNLNLLQADIQSEIANNLENNYAIGLRKLKVNLKPYNHRDTVAVV